VISRLTVILLGLVVQRWYRNAAIMLRWSAKTRVADLAADRLPEKER
jgi:hypothetical protein